MSVDKAHKPNQASRDFHIYGTKPAGRRAKTTSITRDLGEATAASVNRYIPLCLGCGFPRFRDGRTRGLYCKECQS